MSLARSPSSKCRASRKAECEALDVGEAHENETGVVRERPDPRASYGCEAYGIEVGEFVREAPPPHRAVGERDGHEHRRGHEKWRIERERLEHAHRAIRKHGPEL